MLSIGLNSPLGVAGLPVWFHLVGAAALLILGLVVFFGLGLLLDGAATRHVFHFRYRATCGRCADEDSARRHDKKFKDAPGGLTGIARALHDGSEARRD